MKIQIDELDRELEKFIKKLNLADKTVYNAVEKMVTEGTDKLLDEAVMRAPLDEGFLQASLERKIEKKPKEIVGHVFIPANSPASPYALYMHEGVYNLGVNSLDKQSKVKVKVGRKYLERALLENKNKFKLYFIRKIKELL